MKIGDFKRLGEKSRIFAGWRGWRYVRHFDIQGCKKIITYFTGWWFQLFFIFNPTWGNDPIWRAYFSDGLKPPTSLHKCHYLFKKLHLLPGHKHILIGTWTLSQSIWIPWVLPGEDVADLPRKCIWGVWFWHPIWGIRKNWVVVSMFF